MSIANQACAILMREMEILQAQELPKFSILDRLLRAYCINKKQAQRVFRSLRILQIAIWKEYDSPTKDSSDFATSVEIFLSGERISYSILKTIGIILGDELLEVSLNEVGICILLDFKKFAVRSLTRIIKQLSISNTEYQSEDLIIVSTMDGRLCAIDYFLGIIVWSFKPGTPLILNKLPPLNCNNGKILDLVPSLGGALYKVEYDFLPKPLQISMEQLFSSCPSIGDVILTGSKMTFVKNLSLPVGYINHKNNAQRGLEKLDKNKNCIPKIPLVLKSTIQVLKANCQNNMRTKWSMSVTEYEIGLKKDAQSPEIQNDSSEVNCQIKVDSLKGIIIRQISPSINFFWKIKLRSSIASVWILENKRLQKLDLFSSLPTVRMNGKVVLPTFYYGFMGDCRYIRESSQMKVQPTNEINLEEIFTADDQFLFYITAEGCKALDIGWYVYLEESSIQLSRSLSAVDEMFKNVNKDIKDEKYNSEFFNTFEYIKVLGNGAFGSVFEARHRHANCNYAIKRIDKKEYELDQIVREVQAQANLDHVNLVRYYHSWLEEPPLNWDDPLELELENEESSLDSSQPGSYPTSYEPSKKAYFYIQMQLCKEGNLRDWLTKYNVFEERSKKYVSYFKQIVSGVEYIHEQGFIHRDLKPENIFFFTDDHIKIGDFGLTTNIIDPLFIDSMDFKLPKKLEHTLNVGTSFYIAPEQKVKTTYDNKVDIWALGIILVELLSIFKTGVERIKVLEKLHNETFSPELINAFPNEYELLRLMLSHDPTKRPTTYGVRAHSPINDKNVEERFYFRMPSKCENNN
ncbi:eukaryotic translation initiation factor 2-alpha kinase-like isoform X2 [Arctopsyche grandis]|uniref:eukaryotic translation initiation factor 2-alpha kinase-like isoform X2 n=1 Tax=Arctopsyche grandis TaxID=121162 RepID=UPI00406D940D